ncbi:MAG: zinc-dependent peptidase [Gammaproteobacteria bacterium]|nr:zinc-dependent peptidase [Gammaproteobacteria bacterium]
MFQVIRNWLDRRIIRRSVITQSQWDSAFALLPLLAGYTAEEKNSLRKLAILFLHHKIFEGADGLVVTPPMTLIIALQACIPVLKLGLDGYEGWVSVIVYPAGFAPERVVMDEFGVQHRVQSNLSGEAWQRGPVVLAWNDTEHAGIIDGHNLVIHEFAHKLDMQTGNANGFPPLHADMSSAEWFEVFSEGFKDFERRCSHGKRIKIDCYGAASPAEYFAVMSEVFFERPEVVLQYYPDVYDQLRLFYRQDPLVRMSRKKTK